MRAVAATMRATWATIRAEGATICINNKLLPFKSRITFWINFFTPKQFVTCDWFFSTNPNRHTLCSCIFFSFWQIILKKSAFLSANNQCVFSLFEHRYDFSQQFNSLLLQNLIGLKELKQWMQQHDKDFWHYLWQEHALLWLEQYRSIYNQWAAGAISFTTL